MSRLPPVRPETFTPAQKEVYDRLASRGGFGGFYPVLLRSAELSSKIEQLGRYIRFESGIPERLAKVAVLVVARHWRSDFQWGVHAKLAIGLGLPQEIVDAIGANQRPVFADVTEAVVYDYSAELMQTGRVSEATFDKALAALGELMIVNLGGLIAFYSFLALIMNPLEIEAPEGSVLPWS